MTLLRKVLANFLNATYFYLRHLFPLLKRLVQLIWRKEKRVHLDVQVKQSDLVMDGRSVLELTITASNMFMVKVNGFRIPILSASGTIKVRLTVEKEVRNITLIGRGIKHHITFQVPINDKRHVARNVRLKQKSTVEIPVVILPVIKPKHQSFHAKSLILQIKLSHFYTTKKTPFIRYQALTQDLFEKLAHNSKTNEQ